MHNGLSVGIDASNIRHGGGLTHLSQLIAFGDPQVRGIGRVILWANHHTLSKVPERSWLVKRHLSSLDRSLPHRLAWQQTELPRELRREGCDILFAPGGLLPLRAGVPTITMSQNMLPFEPKEAARFGRRSPMWWKMRLLRHAQGRSLRHADGVIFLTDYARDRIRVEIGLRGKPMRVIAHGLEPRFFLAPRTAIEVDKLSAARPFRLLYVSIVDVYKHQWHVVRAIHALRHSGVPIELDLIGPATPQALAMLRTAIDEIDPSGAFVRYRGPVPFEELHDAYQAADAFVFASSCENLPNILLEAMAAGLPIASSSYGPMPEVLGSSAVFFDPVSAASIAAAITALVGDAALRTRLANEAYAKAQAFSWEACAHDTFAFIAEIGRASAREQARCVA
jgi:glycosyltransferase involved in cell wall biosynthesis